MVLSLALFSAPASADPSEDMVNEMLANTSIEQEVELVSAGKGKKHRVGFYPKPGAESTTKMTNAQSMEMTIIGPDGKPVPLPNMGQIQPTTSFVMNAKVGDELENGIIPVHYTYGEVGITNVPPEMAAEMEKSLEMVKGLGFTAMFQDGKIVQMDISSKDKAVFEGLQSMVDQFASQMPVFPDDKIGVGAVYTTNTRMSFAGLDMVVAQNATVREISKNHITTEVAYTMTLGSDKMELPGLPPGADISFSKFEGVGEGMLTVNLDDLSYQGTLEMDVDVGMKVSGPELPQAIEMQMGMEQTTTYE